MRRLPPGRLFPVILLAALTSCSDAGSVSVDTGELMFSVSATSLRLPTELRDGDRVASLPCTAGTCPALDGVTFTCAADVCDPAARTISVPVGEVLDFDALAADFSTLFTVVDAIEVDAIQYVVQLNTLTVSLGELEVHWGPEGAVDIDPAMDVHRLATLPPRAARSTGMGDADIDIAGRDALSDYLVGTSRRIRLFVRTRVDLAPGDPFPEGEANVVVVMRVTARGAVLD
jgi:hypothetical protein